MAGTLQPLASQFPITNSDGTPTAYFVRWAQQRQIDIGTGVTDVEVKALIAALKVTATSPIVVTGTIATGLTISFAGLKLDDLLDVDTSTTPPTDGQALAWDDTKKLWVPETISGGGGGGTTAIQPSVKQFAAVATTTWPVTLPAVPTPGNLLIVLCTQYSLNGVGAQNGYTVIKQGGTGSPDDIVWVLAKIVTSGESAAQSALNDPNPRGLNAVVYEIVNWSGTFTDISAATVAIADETGSNSVTISPPVTKDKSLFLAMVASTGDSTIPEITGGPVIDQSVQGTSPAASPRAITVAHKPVNLAAGATITAAWPSALDNYAAGIVIPPLVSGGIPDAPSDGNLYGRENAEWVEVPAPGIADAPSDGTFYGRESGVWVHPVASDVGLGNVNNTSDANKPVSTAQKAYTDAETTRATTAEGLLAPKVSPTLTGTPTAPTPATGTNTTQIATTAGVLAQIAASVSGRTITLTPASNYSPLVNASAGTLNAVTVNSATYLHIGNLVFITFDVSITDAGSAAGQALQISTPSGLTAVAISAGISRELLVTGYTASVIANGGTLQLNNYDNTPTVRTGTRYAGSVWYVTGSTAKAGTVD